MPKHACNRCCLYRCCIGRFLSQAPEMRAFNGETLPDLLESQNIGNSTLTCSNSLWQYCTPRFLFHWTVVRWWSQRSRENGLWRPITFESLNGIVCGWSHYNTLCETYHSIFLNLDSDNILQFMIFGPNIPNCPQIDPHAHDKRLKIVALVPTVPIFNQLYLKNWFGPILTCLNINALQKGASVFGLARSWPCPSIPGAPQGCSVEKSIG